MCPQMFAAPLAPHLAARAEQKRVDPKLLREGIEFWRESSDAVLVEGPEDDVGVIATARKLQKIAELPDEIGVSVVVAGSKGEIPKFQRILNAFELQYAVLLELDGKAEDHPQNAAILTELNGNRIARIPNKLESLLGLNRHFEDQREARQFFSDPDNINANMEAVVAQLLP